MTLHQKLGSFAAGWLLLAAGGNVLAEDLYLAEGNVFPGRLQLSEGFTAERLIHNRATRPDPAYPRAVTKLAQVAVGPEGKIYFCSGLDGSLMHLLDGRNEIQACEFPGQIRDLACSGEEHTVYFSVVPTPQNGEPLADGKIYRRDFWDGRPTEVATIRQADIGGHWWGTFTISGGAIYLATLEPQSRLFKLTEGRPVQVFLDNTARIQGLAAGYDGSFFVATGGARVYRTADFQHFEPVLATSRNLTDVALRAAADSPRP